MTARQPSAHVQEETLKAGGVSSRLKVRRARIDRDGTPEERLRSQPAWRQRGCSPQYPDARSRCARNPLRARLHLREAARHRTHRNAKPASEGGSAYPAEVAGKSLGVAIGSFP